MFNGLVAGITYPYKALKLFVTQPALLSYMVFPLLLNVLLAGGIYLGIFLPGWQWINGELGGLSQMIAQWVATLPPWLGFLDELGASVAWIVRAVLSFGLLLGIGLLFAQFGALLGSPWYGKLSERIEQIRIHRLEIIEVGLPQDVARALQFELKKLLLLVSAGGACLLLNVLPGFGSAAASVGGVVLGATLVCLDFLDAPLERRRLTFRRKLGLIYLNIPATASFGLTSLFLVSIPFLNLLTVPLCVASGTLFFCDRLWPKYFQQGPVQSLPT